MLKVAIPNKGSLSEPAITMLREAGYHQRRDARDLVLLDEENGVEFFYIRPRDVAVYVGAGTVDVGITGRDLLRDSRANAIEHRGLGFGRSTFRFAAPTGVAESVSDLAGKRIATSYDAVVREYLADNGVEADVVHLDGAVESSVRLGVADVIADVVQTGSTLRAAGLNVFGEPIMESEAVLIRNPDVPESALEVLDWRLEGVITARSYVMIDYDCDETVLPAAVEVTPGFQSPTISPLMQDGWYAVRSMILRKNMNAIMDELHRVGAKGIIVTPILVTRM